MISTITLYGLAAVEKMGCNFMRARYLCLFSVFLILGCNGSPGITPDYLPKAAAGQPYQVKIEIEKVILVNGLFVDSNIARRSGLTVNTGAGEPPYSDNTVEIQGTPAQEGKYQIVLEGQTRNAYGGSINFRKKYDLVVLRETKY